MVVVPSTLDYIILLTVLSFLIDILIKLRQRTINKLNESLPPLIFANHTVNSALISLCVYLTQQT